MVAGSHNRKRDLTQLVLSIAIIVLCNYLGSFVFHRFDLTSEKRYTLSDATRKLLEEVDDVVYFKVYLEGDFPAGFKRLASETKEMLDEFRAYSNGNIEYEFINPSASTDQKQRKEIYKQLYEHGLEPTNLEVKGEAGNSQQIIFPGALITHRGREVPLQLLKTQMGVSSSEQLNNSVQALEYEISNSIRKLRTAIKPVVAFVEGHYELDSLQTADITRALEEYYEVRRVPLNEQLKALDDAKAVIIAKPDSAFSERDKFIIDQFIMKGGRALWLIDPVNTPLDSLRLKGYTMGLQGDLNLDDQLFKYGVRLNNNLLLDVQCAFIPVNQAFEGQQPRFEMSPWLFFPLFTPGPNHPITRNLELIKSEFVSTIDTVGSRGIKKTILLNSSKYSKPFNTPVRVALGMTRMQIDERRFDKPFQPVAVLLEGAFESNFKNRLTPAIAESKEIGFKENGVPTKMIIVADGDIIRNDLQDQTGQPYPLGYDKYTRQVYGNKTFILNCMNYLLDESGLISVRSREIKLRLLDKKKVNNERSKWMLMNTALPVGLVLVFGLGQFYYRKRKYAS